MYLYKPNKNSYTRQQLAIYLNQPLKLRLYVYKSEKSIESLTAEIKTQPVRKIKVSMLKKVFKFEIL
jgi:hypothetical protein